MFDSMKLASIFPAMALVLGLIGCEGNNSTMTQGGSPVIIPIEIDKTIEALDWDQNNEVLMASHAYRSIANNSMLATVYSGQSAIFKGFISLVQGSRDVNCNVSGSIDAQVDDNICRDVNDAEVACKTDSGEANPAAKVVSSEQRAIFYQCQNGIFSGQYFHGPLRVVKTDDTRVENVYINETKISAFAEVNQQDENGNFVFNADNEVVKVQATDFLLQDEYNTFFMSYDYDLKTEFDTSSDRFSTRGIEECTEDDKEEPVEGSNETVFVPGTSIVTQETLSSDRAAALQQPSPQFSYTEYTDLSLIAVNDNFRCEDLNSDNDIVNESLRYDTTYTLATKVESKALGKDTQLNWADLVIPADRKNIEGTITLTHTNQDTSEYKVTVVFDGMGAVTVNNGSSMTVAEFLAKSALVTE